MPLLWGEIRLNGITTYAIRNPKLSPRKLTECTHLSPEMRAHFECLKVTEIDVQILLKVLNLTLADFFNDPKQPDLFLHVEQTGQDGFTCLVPTQYFYDHEKELGPQLSEIYAKRLGDYFSANSAMIGYLEKFFNGFAKECCARVFSADPDAAKLKNMRLLEFLQFEHADPIDYFNELFGIKNKDFHLVQIQVKQHESNGPVSVYVDINEYKKICTTQLRSIKKIILEGANEARSSHIANYVPLVDKITQQVKQVDKQADLSVSAAGYKLDNNEISNVLEAYDNAYSDCLLLLERCGWEGFSCPGFYHVLDKPEVIVHLNALYCANYLKIDPISPLEKSSSNYQMTKNSEGHYQLEKRIRYISDDEFHKILKDARAAQKYLMTYTATIKAMHSRTQAELNVHIEKKKLAEYEAEQRALVEKSNIEARDNKQQLKSSAAAPAMSTVPAYQSATSSTQQFTFMQGLITYRHEQVYCIGATHTGINVYLYFNPLHFKNQDLNVFTGESVFKVTGAQGSGTKPVHISPAIYLQCRINNKLFSLPITYEMKPHGTEQRLFCVQCPDDAGSRRVLLIPLIHTPEGIHTEAGITSLRASSKSRIFTIILPPVPALQLESAISNEL